MEIITSFLDEGRKLLRLKHLSLRTEEAHRYGIKGFLFSHHTRQGCRLGVPQIRAYLSHLTGLI